MGFIKKFLFNQVVRFAIWYAAGTVITIAFSYWLAEVTLKIPYFDFTRELK